MLIYRRLAMVSVVWIVLSFASTGAFAKKPPVEEGDLLVTKQKVIVRDKAPAQTFGVFVDNAGKEIGSIEANRKVEVIAVESVRVPLGRNLWVKVKARGGMTGWVYYGNNNSSPNFRKQ